MLIFLLLYFPLRIYSQTIITGETAPGGVKVPNSPCPGLFEYYWWRNEVVGGAFVTPPEYISPENPINFNIYFALEGIQPSGYGGTVEFFVTQRVILSRLDNGDKKPLPYRIRFPLRHPIPKLQRIVVNGKTLCFQEIRASPTITFFSLGHVFKVDQNYNYNPSPWAQQENYGESIQNSGIYQPPPTTSTQRTAQYYESSFYQTTSKPINNIPVSPCPNVFSYRQYGREYTGIANVPVPNRIYQNDPVNLTVTLQLDRYTPSVSLLKIELVESTNEVSDRLNSGDLSPITYRINFGSQDSLPKLSKLEVNGNIVCQANSYGGFTILTLRHTLLPNGDGLVPMSGQQQRPVQQPQQSFQQQQRPVQQPQQPFQQPQQSVQQPQRPVQQPQRPVQQPQQPFQQSQQPKPQPSWQQRPQPKPTTAPIQTTTKKVEYSPQFTFAQPTTSPSTTKHHISVQSTTEKTAENEIDICGRQIAPSFVPLVVNGTPTTKGQWPWLTAIFVKTYVGQDFQCGGSLITTSHVLTAAHCVIKDPSQAGTPVQPNDFTIYVGKYNLRKTEVESQARDVLRIVMHPRYGIKGQLVNDIAIFILEHPVELTPSVLPVCLWPDDKTELEHVIKKRGTVVGWGRDESGNRISDTSKMISLPLVSQEECLRSHSDFYHLTTENTFCAGGKDGAGPCNGDSGGGIFFKEIASDGSSRWMVRGLVSVSLKLLNGKTEAQCDLKNYVVFTDVAKYLPWIKKTLEITE